MSKRAGGNDNDVLSPDFLDFITCLNEHAVDVVLVGGYALAIHGVVRATGDIDFLYRRTKAAVRRLCAAMEEFGAPPDVIDEDALMTPAMVTQFGMPPHRIDLLSAIDGVTFEKVWAGATAVTIQGQMIRVIGLAELRTNKASTGRSKDAEDVRRLAKRPRRKKR
ncbi:MAG TPA: nucleotidyltransferase [Gemmatimonadaceae bacterium]|nr:nucleotidyltransferase [Gemmatimonadaceae bacterium]